MPFQGTLPAHRSADVKQSRSGYQKALFLIGIQDEIATPASEPACSQRHGPVGHWKTIPDWNLTAYQGDGPGKTGQRTLHHRVAGGQRDAEIAAHLEG